MVRSLVLAFCALLCLFVLSARSSEVNVPWPPSSLPDCDSPWDRYGDAYNFCHATFDGTNNDPLWDSFGVSNVEIEPCNWDYFLLDAASYGDLQVGDWLQISLDFGVDSPTPASSSLSLVLSFTGVPPTSITNDVEDSANTTYTLSPWTLSMYPEIWVGVGHYRRNADTAPGHYNLFIQRYRTYQECEECICDPAWGYEEIDLTSTNDNQIVLSGSVSYSNDTRPDFDADADADATYSLLRNFYFNVPSSVYRPGAYLDINVTILDDSTGAINAYLSEGPYAVDPKSSDPHYSQVISLGSCGICPNDISVSGSNCHLFLTPCDFYYGDYYLSLEFENFCPTGASYEIIVNVVAPIVQPLTLAGSPQVVSFSNDLQTNIFLGAQADYSQYDHYVLTVSGITDRTHAFARLTSVYGYNMGLYWRASSQTDNAIAFEDRDRVLVPRTFNGNSTCDDSCYDVDNYCTTLESSPSGSACGCSFYVRSCDLEETNYYLSVVPLQNSGAYVDVQSYHIEVSTHEDTLQIALVPGEPISTTLSVYSPFQVYVFATPNAVDTWAVFELFVRSVSSSNNQLAQPALKLDLQQSIAFFDDSFICSDSQKDALQTCTTSSEFYRDGSAAELPGVSYPTACHLFVDSCKLKYGAVYLSVSALSDDISSFGITEGHWDYVLWGDLETPWALESDVTYTDRVRVDQYNHYYIDVDDSIEAGAWLSVDFEQINAIGSANFISYLNYESLAGDCPCYKNVDICQLSSGTITPDSCESDEHCPYNTNGWESNYGFDLEDNAYPVQTENDAGACRVQATACSFRPGRWYISASAYSGSSGSGSISIGRDAIPVALPTLPVDTGDSVEFVGYTITARIHAAPVVSELEFNSLVTEQLAPSEVMHFQLTDIDADGDDLVISVHWYSEVLSRFYEASGCLASSTSPKSFADDWGVELRLNFGDLAFDECYEHPWSCKADVNHGASCEIIVPACKWAVVDPEQIFVSARYNRGLFTADYYETLLNGCSLDKRVDPLDVLAPEFWVGNAQINLQVTSERAEVTALAVGTPIYGSVLKDRYAHYTFQLLSTQSLRTDIDVYFHVQSTIDDSGSAPIVALNSGALAGNGRGCRDCFSALRSCQDIANCHWTFDSCNGLSTDTDYYLSVYKPANAFYNQALEFSVAVSQQDLVIPVSLGSANRLTTSIALQNGDSTRAFFAIDGSSLPERVTPLDYLSIRLWNNGIATSGFTYYLNHGGLAGACDCFTARCQNTVSLSEECPINSDSENFFQIYEKDLSAGTYFLTLEFPGASASNGVVFTIEVELVTYEVVARTPTNLRGSSNTQFFLGDANLRYGEDITLDYNEGYNMDNWLTTTGGLIDWDETNNVIRDEKIYGWRNIPQYFGLQAPERFSDASQLFKFYAITITNPADEPGHVMPDRVFLGIDNIRSDIDNCYTFDAENLVVFWHGTEDQALAPINAEVNQAERACTSYPANYGLSIGSPSGSPVSPVLFTELPVCLFTHAGAATHYFSVALTGEYSAWELDLADIESVDTVFPAVVYDIRFFLQKPIVMQDLEAFYTATSNYLTETVGFPFTTNWQPLLSQNGAGSPTLFKQRFVLDLTGSGDLSDSLVQVVIETDNQLFVTVNGDYAPNQPITTGGATCWFNECSSRSLLEFRQSTLSYLQLNPAAIGDDYVSAAANNTMNFVDPSSDFVYTCETDSCVFTLDPCALSQTSLWYFDITSSGNNASFAIYYTEPEDLITGNVYEIAAIDIEDRNWVPTGTTTFGGVDGVDDYEFYHISSSVLSEVLSGEGRARLEIQVDWEEKFTTQEFANDQWASVVISAEKPLYVRGQNSQFPFSNPAYNDAFTADTLPTNFIWTDSSDIPYCFEPFYISVSGGAYNTTNSAASGAERFFLDGCDLQGISELWLTARMLTPGYFDFQFLVRVVRDKEIDATDQTIGTGYASAASITVESDTTSAIEPNSFNHHKFVLPSTLQSESAAATTVNVELFFPDDQIYRNNGTYWLLFSTDAPAGWTGTATPDNYVSSTDSRYPLYNGLRTFGSMASEGSIPLGSRVKYDCYSNLIQYTADPITFDPLDTGFVPVGDFDAEYRSRRTIDLFNFRYATYLYVSVYYETDWEQFFPDEQDETDLWQGYIVNVWLQPQPSEESPFPIHQNGSALDLCYDGLDGVTTDTGIYPNVAGFDYNISWAIGGKSLLVTWFSFELTEDLISLDCSLSSTDSECYFTQYLEFQIFNDDFLQDSTTGTPELYFDGDFGVYGPGSISLGGELNDFDTTASDFDMFGGNWILHDSRVDGDDRRSNLQSLGLNTSSPVWQFGPCSAQSDGYSYLPDRDWEFDESFSSPVGRYTLRAGLYYIPIWSFDSLDLTICASLNSIGYDYTWIDPATPYEPNVLTDYDTGAADSSVDTLAQVVVDWNDLGGDRYDYYWFQLSEAEITSSQQYLQIWLDRVLECTDGTPVTCGPLDVNDRLILQMFRSDCQLWSCDASGNGAGCEGRWQTGTDNEDGNFGDVSRFILGGAGLSSCSLTAGDFFIKVYLPQSATYTLSVYLRTPPTLTLTEAVAVRSTIYSATFQHYQFTASDTSSSLLTSLTVELTEVLCGSLELFAKHGTPAGPFYPTNLDRTTFIGSQMYSPNTFLPDDDDFDTYVSGSSFEKCASAYCIAADGDRDCSIHIGTTELSKDLDSTGLIGSTTWFFAVRSISAKYYTDNDASIDSFMDPFVTSDSASGNGFTEPSTYFITVTTTYADLSAGSIGCAVVSAEVEPSCPPVEPSESNPSVVHFGFETVTLFTDAVVYASSYSLNATTVWWEPPVGVNQFDEPFKEVSGDWTHLLSSGSALSVVGPQNVFTSEATYADFYHYPVTLLSPGIIYSSTGHGYSVSSSNTFLSSKRIFYEFSPALTSTVSFSLTLVDGSGSAPSCVRPKFWIEEDCGVFASASPSDSLFLTSCPDALPRFFSFCLGSCSGTCAQGECYVPVQWEFGYSPVPITDLELGVQSCGDSWEVTPVTAELSSGSCEKEWVFFSLPETPEFTGETANWLSLDFYTELEYPLYDSNIYFYDSDSYLCPTTSNSGRDDSYEHGGFVCPGSRNMAVRSDSFVNDISTAAITPSLFSIPVIDTAATLSTSTFTSTVEIEVKSTDAVWFDLLSGYAIYKVTVPDIDSSVSSLSFAFDSSYGCSNFDWWINFGAPLPSGCADISTDLLPCEFQSGDYFVTLRFYPINPYYYSDWSAILQVSLTTAPVLAVPEDGTFSASYTLPVGESVLLQTSLSSGWLKSHPALQSAFFYRVISPLGIYTLSPEFDYTSSACFDCLVPLLSTTMSNPYDAPLTFTVQFELISDLFLLIDPNTLLDTPSQPASALIASYDQLLWIEGTATPLLTPYFDQRSATVNAITLGTAISSQLYNAFTSRQIQAYVVDTVTANSLAQLRLANVVGGLVSMQVFPASLVSNDCGDFKECHSVPLQWSKNHGLLQASPLNNIAGSCSVVYTPCEWAASPSWFVVLHDHVLNDPDFYADIYDNVTSPIGSIIDFDYGVNPENISVSNPDFFFRGDYTPTQNNPLVAVTFDLIVTEESWTALTSTPSASVSFSQQESTPRSEDNPAGNWQHFFYSYEASDVTSVRIIVDVSAASAQATSGVWVTVTDSDCGCGHFFRNVWCSAEYPSWLCEIEVALHAEHPLESTTFYVDVYGLKGSFSVAATEGLDGNCVFSDGESFCPTRILNYPFWPSLDSSDLDDKASCLYDELLSFFETPCDSCYDVIDDECQLALMEYACAATFQPCDVAGFIDASICVDKCTAVEAACPYSFVQAGLPNLDCGHARYSTSNCF